MKVFDWKWIAILGLGIVILILLLFRKPPSTVRNEDDIKRLRTYAVRKQTESKELKARIRDLEKIRLRDSLKSIASLSKFSIEVDALQKEVARLRGPVKTKIQNDPQLLAFVDAQDSVISFQGGRIQALQDEARITALLNRDLMKVQVQWVAVNAEVDETKDKIIAKQAKEIRKRKAGKVFRNVLIPMVAIGAFILGANAN